MKNPRAVKLSGEIFDSLDRFCSKHGLVKKAFIEQAVLAHLAVLEKMYGSQK